MGLKVVSWLRRFSHYFGSGRLRCDYQPMELVVRSALVFRLEAIAFVIAAAAAACSTGAQKDYTVLERSASIAHGAQIVELRPLAESTLLVRTEGDRYFRLELLQSCARDLRNANEISLQTGQHIVDRHSSVMVDRRSCTIQSFDRVEPVAAN